MKPDKKDPLPEPAAGTDKEKNTPPQSKNGAFHKKWRISVKLAVGVALASNICILSMLGAMWYWDLRVSVKSDALMQVQKDLNTDLRSSVSRLQKRLFDLPHLLETNNGKRIIKWFRSARTVIREQTLSSRENWSAGFTRSQRRDLAKGRFVATAADQAVIVSKGLLDAGGEFTNQVHQLFIRSTSPETDINFINYTIAEMIEEGSSWSAMQRKLENIKSDMAEELLLAEKNRTQMVSRFEEISTAETLLMQIKRQRHSVVILVGVISILCNIAIIFVLSRIIIRKPMAEVVQGMKKISKGSGDLTGKLPVRSRDELGELSHWFNRFVRMLHRIISDVHNEMGFLSRSIKKLSHISDTLSRKAARMNEMARTSAHAADVTLDKIQKMAERAEEANSKAVQVNRLSRAVSEKFHHLDNAASDVSESIFSIAESVEEMNTALGKINDYTQQGACVSQDATQKADETAINTDGLRRSAKEINEVLDLIKGIAEQTHLLSFNAAIEAAGAGKYGKGFSIVAGEVKELSRRTSDATRVIQQKIHSMQDNTDLVIQSTAAIVDVIKETHKIMSRISELVFQQSTATNDISENISKAASFAGSVSETLKDAVEMEKDVSGKLKSVSDDARQIEALSKEGLVQTRQTLEGGRNVEQASVETFDDAVRIEKQVASLADMYDKLNRIVIQFKI